MSANEQERHTMVMVDKDTAGAEEWKMWYNGYCLDEQNTGALCFSEAAVTPQIEFVGKVPSMCGLTSLAVRLGNGSAHGGHFAMSKKIKLTQIDNTFAIVDDEDYAQIEKYTWAYDHGYAIRKTKSNGKTKKHYLHREILNARPGTAIDHINGNPLDNRRSNLRFATPSQNMCNSRKKSGGTSKYKGVSWHKAAKKWAVQVNHAYLGLFNDEIEAARFYDKIAIIEYGEFAKTNFQE